MSALLVSHPQDVELAIENETYFVQTTISLTVCFTRTNPYRVGIEEMRCGRYAHVAT